MSGSVGQLVLGVVGAVVGFVVSGFNPYGAAVGWSIGAFAGGLLFPQNYKGPNPNDVKVQNASYGVPIPVVYGMYRVAGNVIWAGEPVKVGTSQSAKGGPSSTTYSYHIDIAIGLCEGPIQGVRRIWANSKLIYDISNPSNFEQLAGSNVQLSNFTVYPGDETQMPDPTIEAAEGAGNVSPNRGLAYIVIRDYDLGPTGSYIPSFTFEVVKDVESEWSQTDKPGQFPLQGDVLSYFNYQMCYQAGTQIYGAGYDNGSLAVHAINKGSISPYGTQVHGTWDMDTASLTQTGLNGPAFGYSDEWGMMGASDAFGFGTEFCWLPLGSVNPVAYPLLDISYSSFALSTPHFVKQGDYVVVAPEGGSGTIAYVKKALIWRGIGTRPAYTAPVITEPGDWIPIGATANFLYCVDNGTTTGTEQIARFNWSDLSLDAILRTGGFSLYNAGMGGVVGCVTNDDELYLCVSAPSEQIWRYTPSTDTFTTIADADFPATLQWFGKLSDNMFAWLSSTPGSNASLTMGFVALTFGENMVPVRGIIEDICARAFLDPAQVDATSVTQLTRGYALTGHTSGRDNLQPLLTSYFLDVSDADGKLKFVPRGRPPALTIPYADIGVTNDEDEDGDAAQNPIIIQIADEVTLPQKLSYTYPAYNTDYQNNTQYAFRADTYSNQQPGVMVPVVLTDNEALGICQSLLWAAWLARVTYQFQTSLKYIALEPSDVIYLEDGQGGVYTVRLTSSEYDGGDVITWSGEFEAPSVYPNPAQYTAQGGVAQGFQPQVIPYFGPSVLAVMDMPPLRNQDTGPGLYLAGCAQSGASWPGENVFQSTDGSAYAAAETLFVESTMGYATTALGDFTGGNVPDEANTVDVFLYNGTLSSISYADFIATRANACVLGRELIFFRTATPIGQDKYRLSGLLRGRQNTADHMADHAIGDPFVFLDTTVMPEDISASLVGQVIYHKAQTVGVTDFGAPIETLVENARVRPFSPYQFAAGKGSASSINDISLQWIRRARVNNEWLNGTNVPLDEAVEAYQLQVLNGAGVVRRIVSVVGATTYVYSAADIAADGFSPGDTINFIIQQNSDQGVLGKPATTSIVRP